ncbi:MAG TPA: EAL domain-containing protein, partial [Gemmatirosa sp.]
AGAAWLIGALLAPVTLTAAALRGYLTRRDAPALPVDLADVDEAGALMADARHAVERLEEIVGHVSTYDRVTGLPNRALFRDQLRHALAQSRRDGRAVGVLVLDLDGFQAINLSLGHAGGDALLAAVAQRLQGVVRDTDVLARLGGDEYAILSANGATVEGLDALARRVVDAIRRPFVVCGREATVAASVGVTTSPNDPGGVDELIGNATTALYDVQGAGGNGHRFYSTDLNARLHLRMALETDLRHALERGQLFLHYQPKMDVATGRVRGFEALLRWQHPERGLVSPVEFIPVAEATGLIVPIGEWVLRTACAQLAAWRAEGLPLAAVSVNLSARQFKHADLLSVVHAALADHAVDPALLELEVTESLLMDDTAHTVAVLQGLREAGVGISLDDFGTGYSSLGYLKRFPIDCIKLDKSFVRDAVTDRQSGAITEAIIALGHSLGLSVVAEGVETPEQLTYLAERACDVVQGYLFGRPMAADAAAELMQAAAGLPQPWLAHRLARPAGERAPGDRLEVRRPLAA